MEAKLDKIIDVVTDIKIDIAKIQIHIEQNTKDLEVHIKRTNILEDRINRMESWKNKAKGIIVFIAYITSVTAAISASVIYLVRGN